MLKRLGSTPLGRPRLLGAKIVADLAVELLQAAVLVAVGFALGWNPGGGGAPAVGRRVGAMVLGTAAFGGIGLFLAGTLRAEVNLAVANALYLVLLLLGGMLVPSRKLPTGWPTSPSCCRPPPCPRRSTAPSGTAPPVPCGVLGRARRLGGGGAGGRRAHLPLGMSARSSAVKEAGVSTGARPRPWLIVPVAVSTKTV